MLKQIIPTWISLIPSFLSLLWTDDYKGRESALLILRYMEPVHVIIKAYCQVTQLKTALPMQEGGHACMDGYTVVAEFEVISRLFLLFLQQVKLPKHIYHQNLSLVKWKGTILVVGSVMLCFFFEEINGAGCVLHRLAHRIQSYRYMHVISETISTTIKSSSGPTRTCIQCMPGSKQTRW